MSKKIKVSKKALAAFSAKKAIKLIDQNCRDLGMSRVERMLILDGIMRATDARFRKLEKGLSNKQRKTLKKALRSKKITKVAAK